MGFEAIAREFIKGNTPLPQATTAGALGARGPHVARARAGAPGVPRWPRERPRPAAPLAVTQAICLKCGASKIGALTPCLKCWFDPATPEEKARSIVLSSHHMDTTSLENAAKAIQAGDTIPIPEDLVSSYATTIDTTSEPRPGRFVVGCLLGIGAVGTSLVGAISAFIGGRGITGVYRLGAAVGFFYLTAFWSGVCFLLEERENEKRARKKRWVLLNALPVAAVVAALVYLAAEGRF